MTDGSVESGKLLIFPTIHRRQDLPERRPKPTHAQLKLLEEKGWTNEAVNAVFDSPVSDHRETR